MESRKMNTRSDPNFEYEEMPPFRRRRNNRDNPELQKIQEEIQVLEEKLSQIQLQSQPSNEQLHQTVSTNPFHGFTEQSIQRPPNSNFYPQRLLSQAQNVSNGRQAVQFGTQRVEQLGQTVQLSAQRVNVALPQHSQYVPETDAVYLGRSVSAPIQMVRNRAMNDLSGCEDQISVQRRRYFEAVHEQVNQGQRLINEMEQILNQQSECRVTRQSTSFFNDTNEATNVDSDDTEFYTAELFPQSEVENPFEMYPKKNFVTSTANNSYCMPQPQHLTAGRHVYSKNYLPVSHQNPNTYQLPIKSQEAHDFNDVQNMMKPQMHTDVNTRDMTNDLQSNLMMQMSRMLARQSEADLWEFNGSRAIDYPLFKKRFFTIYEEGGYSTAQGVAKLDKHIQGEARKLVDIALKTASTPNVIFTALDKVYGRPDAIKREMKHKIDELSKISDWTEFKEFSCVVKNIFIAADYLKDSIKDTRVFMERLLLKLAPHLAVQFGSYCVMKAIPEGQETLQHLADWVDSMSRITNLVVEASWDQASSEPTIVKQLPQQFEAEKKCPACKGSCKTLEYCNNFITATYAKRRKMIDDFRACFICLRSHKGRCHRAKQCGVSGCNRFHHTLLHKETQEAEQQLTMTVSSQSIAMLKFIPIIIKGPISQKKVLAILDDGSTATLIDENLAKEIGLSGEASPFCCKWIEDKYRYEPNSQIVTAEIKGLKKGMKFNKLHNARTVKQIGIVCQEINWPKLQQDYPYIQQVDVSMHNKPVQILIGQNNVHLLRARQTIQPAITQPCMSKTVLGWVVHGPQGMTKSNETMEQLNCCSEVTESELHEAVKEYFKLEDMVVQKKHQRATTEEVLATNSAQNSIVYTGERYVIGLPWKEELSEIPESYPVAFKRLLNLESKLEKDFDLRERYKLEMQKLLDKEYAVEVDPEELKSVQPKWYIPHFYVKNPNKPDKVRIVFDAAAKTHGNSLNSYLLPGPDLLTSLFGHLLRFRKHKISWTADIQEMFNQVRIQKSDTYMQLYLWRNMNKHIQPKVYRMQAMLFGITSSPFLSQFVKNYNADAFQDQFPNATQEIKDSFYVDDWLAGTDDIDEAIKIVHEVNEVQENGGFLLRNYMSNSHTLLQSIPPELKSKVNVGIILNDTDVNRVLGILWNADKDELSFSTKFHKVEASIMDGTKAPTKRQVLSAAMSLFDPVGLLSPYTIKPRILIQNIWRQGIHWDDQIKGKLLDSWLSWLNDVHDITNLKIPRLYSNDLKTADSLEIHMFCDAGDDAYAAAVYLRINKTQLHESCLLAARAKVTPVKPLTIPRLELQSALMGTRLVDTIISELKLNVDEKVYWTDSRTVLAWLMTEKPLVSFVACRVGEILERTNVKNWKWIPSKLNTADLCTKERKIVRLTADHEWFKGPKFLSLPKCEWPKELNVDHEKTEFVNCVIEYVCHHQENVLQMSLPEIKFNYSWYKLLRITGRLHQIIENIKSKVWKARSLSLQDLTWAETMWIKKVQSETFSKDIVNVIRGTKNQDGRLSKLPLVMDESGILRVRNRLQYVNTVQVDKELQIVLDGDHPYVQLLIMHYHLKYKHQFFETVVNEIQRRFKIPHLRSKVSKVFSKCKYCRRMKAKSPTPLMGPLPELRLRIYKKPFSSCGLDYFGPLMVKQGRSTVKRYGALFCCMTTRAVHIEVAADLSTNSCVNAMRRMLARRGNIEELYSDNGSNFKGTNRELQDELQRIDYDAFGDFLVENKIKWNFNPVYSPHMGGAWERLVACIKAPLKAIVQDRILTDDVLQTAMTECEYIVNSRPLTFVSTRDEERVAITPNDLLMKQDVIVGIPGTFNEADLRFGKQWRAAQALADQFWKHFVEEYLNQLKVPKKWIHQSTNLKVNDIVYVAEEKVSRLSWPLGVIVKVETGKDGNVRVAKVKLTNGKVSLRKVQDLYPLGLSTEDAAEEQCCDASKKTLLNTGGTMSLH